MSLEIKNISFDYSPAKQKNKSGFQKQGKIESVSLTVSQGGVCALIGPNGSGKSTLLSVCSGLLLPSSGTITFNGLPHTSQVFRSQLGVVFQSPSLDSKLTVVQNLDVACSLVGIKKNRKEKIEWALNFAELESRKLQKVSELSGGLKRRLDIARAFLHEPKLLLLDEPSSGLDEYSFRKMWANLSHLNRQFGVTIVVATHKPEEAEKCSQLAIISRGKIVKETTPSLLKLDLSGELIELEFNSHLVSPAEMDKVLSALNVNLSGVKKTEMSLETHKCEILLPAEISGATFIPNVLKEFEKNQVTSVKLRYPNLGDAFVKIAGESLFEEQ
jgi:ABC-2 type transport system ATP-binding protein